MFPKPGQLSSTAPESGVARMMCLPKNASPEPWFHYTAVGALREGNRRGRGASGGSDLWPLSSEAMRFCKTGLSGLAYV